MKTIRYSIPTTEQKMAQTRKCLDPWAKFVIKANGDVWLCCNNTIVGNINEEKLDNILNNEKSMAYRKGLLTGNPLPECKYCHEKPACSVNELLALVNQWYTNDTYIV